MTGDVAPVATAQQRQACEALLHRWLQARQDDGLPVLAAGRDAGTGRWFVRLRGTEKDIVTVWLHLRQRTLAHEAQMMPGPETHREEVLAYLLRRNVTMGQLRFALGPEDAVYVVGEVPVARVDEDELDRVVGGSLAAVDDCFPTAMAMGHAGLYRRRPPRRSALRQ